MPERRAAATLERPLEQWLTRIEELHPSVIEMGLERVGEVAKRLNVLQPAPVSVIVAGTNGKGSTAVFTEALLLEMGYTVGTTLSPHVEYFNERVRINGSPCEDATLCESFAVVEAARGAIPLTYFEFAALVALTSFHSAGVEVAILEVGLGGRLDAFNIVAADVAVVTNIGIDHVDYLGSDPEQIGREKAGVLRPSQAAVFGESITRSVMDRARELGCRIAWAGSDFTLLQSVSHWSFRSAELCFDDLPTGALAAENCALGIAAANWVNRCTAATSGLSRGAVVSALDRAWLPGRFETVSLHNRRYILDVAHNAAGAAFLREQLARNNVQGLVAIIGALRDKDTTAVIAALQPVLGYVICVGVEGARGLGAEELAGRLPPEMPHEVAPDLAAAFASARSLTGPGDVILACGSFAVIGKARLLLREQGIEAKGRAS